MLARIQGIVGPFPRWMLLEGEEASKYFTPEGCVYKRVEDDSCEDPGRNSSSFVGRCGGARLMSVRWSSCRSF